MQRLALRPLFALTAAGISLLATVAVALLVGRETSDRLRLAIGADLTELAHHLADNLDRGLHERWRDIQVAASFDDLADPGAAVEEQRIILERLLSIYPDYAFIGLTGPDGRFRVTTLPALDGVDVGKRAYFVEGRQGPFVGDVHDAVLLANLLGGAGRDPARFVDLAAPVQGRDGAFRGVIVAHLNWRWAEEMQQALRVAASQRHPAIEVLVLARDGTVLLGPPDLLRTRLAAGGAEAVARGASGSTVAHWPDGEQYLSGYHRTAGYRDFPGLGWAVLVRERAAVSFAPVGALQARIAAWGGLVALGSAVLAWLAAGWITRPLRALARAAETLGDAGPLRVPADMPREIAQLGQAMRAASAQLAARENRQTLLIAELNHRVKNTLATVQAMATLTARGTASIDSYRQSLEGRLLALSKTHNLLTEAFWETVTLSDLLRNELAPFDDGSGARVVLDGPAVSFIPRVAVALGMAMHELTTNAAKYGSLSVPGGRVEVRWSLSPGRAPYTRLRLDWTERDGPAVALPEHRGFGSRLIWQSIARELDGELYFDYPVEGLRCAIVIEVSAAGPTVAERGEGDLPRAA